MLLARGGGSVHSATSSGQLRPFRSPAHCLLLHLRMLSSLGVERACRSARAMGSAAFAVARWLQDYTRATSSVQVSQPVPLGCWTKQSSADNGSGGGGVLFGDTSGACAQGLVLCCVNLLGCCSRLVPPCMASHPTPGLLPYRYSCERCPACLPTLLLPRLPHLPLPYVGLLPYAPPHLPASLENGVQRYIAKQPGEDVGVETVVRAAAAAGKLLDGSCDVLTFRNNLNKVFGTPFELRAAWTVDACLLCLNADGGDGGGSRQNDSTDGSGVASSATSGDGSTLFLDIVPLEQAWVGDRADMERFTRWGYT